MTQNFGMGVVYGLKLMITVKYVMYGRSLHCNFRLYFLLES